MKTSNEKKTETACDLKLQLNTLMDSLATLSAEKSKMEAQFQTDRKQLRSDREEVHYLFYDKSKENNINCYLQISFLFIARKSNEGSKRKTETGSK